MKARKRKTSSTDIAAKLRDAGDYLGALIKHDAGAMAAKSGEACDEEAYQEAYRLFCRDLATFTGAMRTVWNYLIQLTNQSGQRAWLDARLYDDVICRFHRELANQDLHDRPFVLAIDQHVRVEGTMSAPMRPGHMPLNVPLKVVGFAGVTFYYNADELEAAVGEAYSRLLLVYGRRPAAELAVRYYDAVQAAFKSGQKRGRFSVVV